MSSEIGVAASEQDMAAALYDTDESARNEHGELVDWARSQSLTKSQRDAQDWRGGCALPVRGALGEHVLNDLMLTAKPFDIMAEDKTLLKLIAHGWGKRKVGSQSLIALRKRDQEISMNTKRYEAPGRIGVAS